MGARDYPEAADEINGTEPDPEGYAEAYAAEVLADVLAVHPFQDADRREQK